MAAGFRFQSTLPRGSDFGANLLILLIRQISIHAPSRERPSTGNVASRRGFYFMPRSLAGAPDDYELVEYEPGHFNPRSLAGATTLLLMIIRALQ